MQMHDKWHKGTRLLVILKDSLLALFEMVHKMFKWIIQVVGKKSYMRVLLFFKL